MAFGSAFLIGLLFGFLPARRAARMDPVTALATE
jgi:macrolide transport system ATP-binding/permease protein